MSDAAVEKAKADAKLAEQHCDTLGGTRTMCA